MTDVQTLLIYVYYIQIFLAVRYVIKSSFGHVTNYNIFKLMVVLFVPVAGYFIVMRQSAVE
jgi:hypothetical protein